MERYRNLRGDSGITHYEMGTDFIRVRFRDGSQYLYDYTRPGPAAVEQMKTLAVAGYGLNGYINTAVRKAYARKER